MDNDFVGGPFCTLPGAGAVRSWPPGLASIKTRELPVDAQAAAAVNDFTRSKMREDGFYRRIMPPRFISNDEIDRQVDTDKPIKLLDKTSYDIRQQLADNAIKDFMEEEDRKFLSAMYTLTDPTYRGA